MNQNKPILKLDWCSYKAAEYAVKHWHYSRSMPVGKLAKIGVWEDDKFIGSVVFGMGAAKDLGNPIGLKMFGYCELVRVALTTHRTTVTKIISIAIKMLKQQSPKLLAIISFADPEEKHLGIIYQAGNWIFCGCSKTSQVYELNGKKYHNRVVNPGALQFGRKAKASIDKKKSLKRTTLPKYRYVYVLSESIRDQIEKLRKPYPKSLCAGSVVARNLSKIEAGDESLTPALHFQEAVNV